MSLAEGPMPALSAGRYYQNGQIEEHSVVLSGARSHSRGETFPVRQEKWTGSVKSSAIAQFPHRRCLGPDDYGQDTLVPAWTRQNVVSKGFFQVLQNGYPQANRDHVEGHICQPSPPPSDIGETTSNNPNSTSSGEESACTACALQPNHHPSNTEGKQQWPDIRKQHTISYHNARRAASRASDHGLNHSDEQEMSSNSDDEKLTESMGHMDFSSTGGIASSEQHHQFAQRQLSRAATYQQPELPSGHQQSRKIPPDPCSWNVEQVQSWLRHECRKHSISPSIQEKFHMNGKGLILIGLQGFQRRAPHGGHLFHRDLQRLLRMQHNREHQWRDSSLARAAKTTYKHTQAAGAAV